MLPQVQELGQLLNLLLGTQLPQAGTHIGPHPAGVPALGAGGPVVQGVGGPAVLDQQIPPPGLEGQVFLPEGRNGRGRVGPLPEGGGHRLGNGGLKPPVDLRRLGDALINLRPAALGLSGPALPLFLQAAGGPAQYACFKAHRLSSLCLPLAAHVLPHPLHILPHPLSGLAGGPGAAGQNRPLPFTGTPQTQNPIPGSKTQAIKTKVKKGAIDHERIEII